MQEELSLRLTLYKITKAKRDTQVVECLPIKCKALVFTQCQPPPQKRKRQSSEYLFLEKIFANQISDKGLISKTY
jgi:hypothetical protein